MSQRPLKPNEKRAWERVARTIKGRMDQTQLDMPHLDELQGENLVPSGAKGFSGHPNAPSKALRPNVQGITQNYFSVETKKGTIANRHKERRVRRGQTLVCATLDLHGHTQESAQSLLISFLSRQRVRGGSCVLIITGKGRLGEGVLRRRLLDWLETQEARPLVSGYAQAHQKHGGSGAWYIFLRKIK